MKKNKKIIIGVMGVILLGVISLLIFWLPSMVVDEYNYIHFTYFDQDLNIISDPNDLLEKNISKWTDVSATFKNDSQSDCELVIQSNTLNINLKVDSNLEYGVIFPKNENISITFCGISKQIYLN